MTMARLKIILKSKTFWGTALVAGANLLSKSPITLSDWAEFAGAIIAAAGVRDAITQHGVTPGEMPAQP
jgi:hypothetical protein